MKKIFLVYRYSLVNEDSRQFECAFTSISDAIDFVQKMNEFWTPFNIVYDYYVIPDFSGVELCDEKHLILVYDYYVDTPEVKKMDCAFLSSTQSDAFISQMNKAYKPYNIVYGSCLVPLFIIE